MLEETQLFVLDMDGTFFMGQSVIEGALDFIEEVKRRKKKFLFFTNNSSRTSESYMEKFSGSGCPINRSQIMTSGDVAVRYLHTEFSGASVYLLGTPSLEESMRAAGITLTEEAPDVVLVAFDKTLTYEKLEKGCTFIREGAAYPATHPDVNCPVPGGFIPDCGAICSAISLSTGRFPKYLGKPYEETVKMIFEHTRVPVSQTAFVGDRLYTDIAAGVKHGARGFLVLTGEAALEDVETAEYKPDAVFASLGEMAGCLRS